MQQIADILEVNVLDLLNDDLRKFKIRQTSHDASTGVAIYNENFEEERRAWKLVEASLREVIEAQKGVIDSLKETITLQKEMLQGTQK